MYGLLHLSSITLDWYKFLKCSAIDPSVLSGETIHRIRSAEMRGLLVYKLLRHPVQFFRARQEREKSIRCAAPDLIRTGSAGLPGRLACVSGAHAR